MIPIIHGQVAHNEPVIEFRLKVDGEGLILQARKVDDRSWWYVLEIHPNGIRLCGSIGDPDIPTDEEGKIRLIEE